MRPSGNAVPEDYPSRVKDLRERLGLTRMADRVGVSFATVNRWENGQSRPTRLAWHRIVDLEADLRASVPRAEPATASAAPALDFAAKPEAVAAIAEATRLSYGYLSNPAFAAEISSIDPLPHQRTAVYDHMLRQWPLRFLLADDAGAGKTIMTGLYLREMLARRLVTRVLVVPPAGLVGNWEREMRTLFRRDREAQVELFRRPADRGGATYLVATDAAGEGINLQFCWLMANYDVPWNPARLEQRMGRIHRYGQAHDPVVIVNLIAGETREGRVLKVLLDKLEAIRKQLRSDKVFDVVGRLFENVSLKGYLEMATTEAGTRDAIETLDGRLTPEQVAAVAANTPAIRHPPRRALSVCPDTTGTAPRPARHVAPRPGSRHAGSCPAGAGSLPRLGGPPGRQLYASPPRATTRLAYRCLCDASTDYAAALQRGTGAASICRFHTPGSSSRQRRLWRPLCAGHLSTASSRGHQQSS